jgi:4-methylaminobutanoate oxidase (formaldehyde-forming)
VVTKEHLESGSYQINVGGVYSPASISLRPPYDPAGDRIKG